MQGLAGATRSSYERYWGLWLDYRGDATDTHPTSGDIAGFIDFMLHDKGWKTSSVKTLLGSLSTMHQLIGVNFPYLGKAIQL